MSGPSDKAVEAVARVEFAPVFHTSGEWLRTMLEAAHDPALGLDRSVCLRDVWSWLNDQGPWLREPDLLARFEREFGG